MHLQLRWRGEVRPFRDVVPLLARWPKQGIGGAIERVETGARWFDVDAKEAFSRVVSTYTISYSNFMPYAPTVRARFFNDPPETQQGFLRAFLDLYDEDTDVTHLKGADAAAAWLRGHRVCRAQQTLVLRDDVDDVVRPVDGSALELDLREALAAFAAVVDDVQRALLPEFRTSPRYHPAMARLTDAQLPTDLQPFLRVTQALVYRTVAPLPASATVANQHDRHQCVRPGSLGFVVSEVNAYCAETVRTPRVALKELLRSHECVAVWAIGHGRTLR